MAASSEIRSYVYFIPLFVPGQTGIETPAKGYPIVFEPRRTLQKKKDPHGASPFFDLL